MKDGDQPLEIHTEEEGDTSIQTIHTTDSGNMEQEMFGGLFGAEL